MSRTGARFEVAVDEARPVEGQVRRTATITSPALGTQELWYEVDEAHAEVLTDRGDPFVLGALTLAMTEGRDLVVTGAQVDAALLRNLVEFQRIWQVWFDYSPIVVHAEPSARRDAPDAAVVAFSGGADSAHSAWTNTRGGGRYPVAGAMMIRGIDIPLTDPDGFARASTRARRMTDSLELDLVVVATNAWTLPVPIGHYTGMGVAAALHVLDGRYGTGLIPSTATYRDLVVPLNSSPVSDWMLGGDAFAIAHDGAAANRFEKLDALTAWPEAMAALRVCLVDPAHDRNCGECHKCMMTLAAFRVLGVEAPCFDRAPTPAELTAWARRWPSGRYYLQEGLVLVDAARARGVDEPWVRALRNRIRVAQVKDGVRAAWPGLADGAASVHRRIAEARSTRR